MKQLNRFTVISIIFITIFMVSFIINLVIYILNTKYNNYNV